MQNEAPMRCLGCGHDLCGLPARRCPECGRSFDPTNWETYEIRHPRGLRWAVTAWTTLAATLVVTITTLLGFTRLVLGLPPVLVSPVIPVRSAAALLAPRSDTRRGDAWLLAFAAAFIVVLGGLCVGSSALFGNVG